MSAIPDHQITIRPPSTDHHQPRVIPEEPVIQQNNMAMLQTKPHYEESGRLLFEPAAHSTPLRPNKPQPITKPNAFATYREKPERKRSSRSTQVRGLEAMQLAMQLRRLELQKRARVADSKGGRMDGVEGEQEKAMKRGKESGKGKESSRTNGAKGEFVSFLDRTGMLLYADAFPGWQFEKGHYQRAQCQGHLEDAVEGKNFWQREQASVAQQAQNSDVGSEYRR
jgi:hypothetical protein